MSHVDPNCQHGMLRRGCDLCEMIVQNADLRARVAELEHSVEVRTRLGLKLERELRIAAGMLSTTPGWSDKHPMEALEHIKRVAAEDGLSGNKTEVLK